MIFFRFGCKSVVILTKLPGFYNNAHLYFYSICLRLVIKKISIFRLKQVEREHITIKVGCFKFFICTDLSDKQSVFDGL